MKNVEVIDTNMKKANQEVSDMLNQNNIWVNDFRYISYTVKSAILRCTIYDVLNNLNEKAKVRENFSVDHENKTITIPNFFVKINGIYKDNKEQKKLEKIMEENAVMYYDYCISRNLYKLLGMSGKEDLKKKILNEKINRDFLKNYMLDYKRKIAEYKNENIINTLNTYTLDYVLDRLNDFILRCKMSVKHKFDDKTLVNFILNIIFMDKNIVEVLNNWDYASYVPKIVIYDETLESESTEIDSLLIDFFNYLGMDIVLFSPSGKSNIENFNFELNNDLLTNLTLEEFAKPKKHTRKYIQNIRKKTKNVLIITTGAVLGILGINIISDKVNNNHVQDTIELINNIGPVSLDKEDEIEAAYKSYNKLNDKYQNKVTNYNVLKTAQKEFNLLVEQKESEERISEIIILINEINDNTSEYDLNNILSKYNNLSYEEKQKISNYEILEIALNKISENKITDNNSQKEFENTTISEVTENLLSTYSQLIRWFIPIIILSISLRLAMKFFRNY